MTDLLSRPILRVSATPDAPRRPIVLSGLIIAGWAAAAGLIVAISLAVLSWFAADTGSFGGAIKIGALGWLVGNGAGLHLHGVVISAIPIGSCLAIGWVLYRGGRWAGSRSDVSSLGAVVFGAAVVAVAYDAVALLVFVVTRSGDVHADLVRTVAAPLVLGFCFSGLGLLRGSGQSERLLDPLHDEVRAALTGGSAGFFVMLLASAAAFTAAFATHFSSAVTLAEGVHAGLVGGAVLALVSLALAPNAVLAAGAFIAGPGFMLGTGTSVAPAEVRLGPLPAFPLLAAVPREGGAWWQTALIVVPLIAGGVAALVAVHRFPVAGYRQATLRGGVAGLSGGVAFGAATWLATGSVGPGRMQDIGPDVLPTLLVCSISLTLGGVIVAAGARWIAGGSDDDAGGESASPMKPASGRAASYAGDPGLDGADEETVRLPRL